MGRGAPRRGAARRFGGADKPAARVGGRALLERVAAAASGADRLVVVGPARDVAVDAVRVREDPPGAGPVPALRAGLAEVRAPRVALLAADLPFLGPGHLARLLAALAGAAPGAAPGAVLVDEDGRDQWLAGCWRAAPLRTALDAYDGTSLRGLLSPSARPASPCPPASAHPGTTATPPKTWPEPAPSPTPPRTDPPRAPRAGPSRRAACRPPPGGPAAGPAWRFRVPGFPGAAGVPASRGVPRTRGGPRRGARLSPPRDGRCEPGGRSGRRERRAPAWDRL
ncbi:molybdenum cofactor guanylyltransferase [Actinomadura sp. WMMB 499]|uniref:molybdenum cofactor guanylyltransferase n=1 Tax=Actinomadura sp. WMMB 499 TaxID=1219491 RepID=UPI0034A0BA7F